MGNRRQLYKYKGDCCLHCGKKVEEMIQRYGTFYRMFQLNHVDPKQKDKNYDNLIRRSISSDQLDEVDKCVLLCTFCHGVVHAMNITATVTIVLRIKNRRAQQTVTGQLIIDMKDGIGTLFTDEPILVWPYWLQIGNAQPRMFFGTQLDAFVGKELRRLERTRKFQVIGWDKKVLMQAMWMGKDGITLRHAFRCPFIKGELYGETGKVELFVRNGKLLSRDGAVLRKGIVTYKGGRLEDGPNGS